MQAALEHPESITLVQWCTQHHKDYGRERYRAIRGEIPGAFLDASNRWRVRLPASELAPSTATRTQESQQ